MFLTRRPLTAKYRAPVQVVEPTSVEKAQRDFNEAAEKVRSKHQELKDKEALFKRLLAEAPQDALIFDALQLDLSRKKAVLQNLGGLL